MPSGRGVGLYAWSGGTVASTCMDWLIVAPWAADVMRAVGWANAGQPVGELDALVPALADGILAVRAEWSAIECERVEEMKRRGNR
jgi:hypothetical protein